MISLLHHIKIRRRTFLYLLVSHFALGVCPVVVFAILAYRLFSSYVGVQVSQAHLDRLHQMESYIGLAMEHIDEKANEFIFNSRFVGFDRVDERNITSIDSILAVWEAEDLLRNLRQTNSLIRSVYYYNPIRDFIITSDGYSVARRRFHDTDWTAQVSEQRVEGFWLDVRPALNRSIIEDPERFRIYKSQNIQATPVLTYVKPVSKYVAPFGGFVAINLDAALFGEWIHDLDRGAAGDFYLLNGEGEIQLSTRDSTLGSVLDPSLREEAKTRPTGSIVRTQQSGPRLIYYFVASKAGWIAVLGRDADEVLGFYGDIGRVTLALALGLVAVAALMALFLSSRFYHPIDGILRAIDTQAGRRPVGTNELSFIHEALSDAVRESRELRTLLNGSAQAIKDNALRLLFSGQGGERDTVLDRLGRTGQPLIHTFFATAIITMNEGAKPRAPVDAQIAQFALIRYCESYDDPAVRMLAVSTDVNKIAVLINTEGREAARGAMEAVRKMADQALSLELKAIIGGFHGDVLGAADSYDEALSVLNGVVLASGDSVVLRDDIELGAAPVCTYPFDIEERIISHLKLGERDQARLRFDKFLERLSPAHEAGKALIDSHCLALVSSIMRAVEHSGGSLLSLVASGNPYRDFLQQDYHLEEIRAWFYRLFDSVIEGVYSGDTRYAKYKQPIQRYIDEHYRRDLSLKSVAQSTGISYSYIRKIFSRLFGCHFPDYLNSLRIEKAQSYLRSSEKKVSEIATLVGYTNEQRFFRSFKRHAGCTPKDYRLTAVTGAQSSP